MIEDAMWTAQEKSDPQTELNSYLEARAILESLSTTSEKEEKERNRVLAYCLMRLDEALVNMGDDRDAVKRATEALETARKSQDAVQIARCLLAYGVRLLNTGRLPDAEASWQEVVRMAEGSEDRDMQQVLGWTFLARASLLKAKSLEKQALVLAHEAERTLAAIDNYAGLASTYNLLAKLYSAEGDTDASDECTRKAEHYKKMAKEERK